MAVPWMRRHALGPWRQAVLRPRLSPKVFRCRVRETNPRARHVLGARDPGSQAWRSSSAAAPSEECGRLRRGRLRPTDAQDRTLRISLRHATKPRRDTANGSTDGALMTGAAWCAAMPSRRGRAAATARPRVRWRTVAIRASGQPMRSATSARSRSASRANEQVACNAPIPSGAQTVAGTRLTFSGSAATGSRVSSTRQPSREAARSASGRTGNFTSTMTTVAVLHEAASRRPVGDAFVA